jgi:hypothetical protein
MRSATEFDAAASVTGGRSRSVLPAVLMRTTIDVGVAPLSVLRHGEVPPVLLLLEGTFRSRMWPLVMSRLGESLPAAD